MYVYLVIQAPTKHEQMIVDFHDLHWHKRAHAYTPTRNLAIKIEQEGRVLSIFEIVSCSSVLFKDSGPPRAPVPPFVYLA